MAASYDRVAAAYTATFSDELERKPFDRELLDAFAARVPDQRITADVGCGPGHVAAYLRARGVRTVAADISVEMLRHARAIHPGTAAVAADFCFLPFTRGALAAIVAFYSLIHAPRAEVAGVLRGFARALRPSGRVLVAVHAGTGETHADEFLGEQVSIDATFFEPEELAGYLREAGFVVEDVVTREPYAFEYPSERLYVTAHAR